MQKYIFYNFLLEFVIKYNKKSVNKIEKEKSKIVHTELKGLLSSRFDIIKSALGIQNDAEVVRFLVQNYYKEHLEGERKLAVEELVEDRTIIKKFMEKYGEEWQKLGED